MTTKWISALEEASDTSRCSKDKNVVAGSSLDVSPVRYNTPTPPPLLFLRGRCVNLKPLQVRSPICWLEVLSSRSQVSVRIPQSIPSCVMKSMIWPVFESLPIDRTFSRQNDRDFVWTCCSRGTREMLCGFELLVSRHLIAWAKWWLELTMVGEYRLTLVIEWVMLA